MNTSNLYHGLGDFQTQSAWALHTNLVNGASGSNGTSGTATTVVQFDAVNEVVKIARYNADGTQIASAGSVTISLVAAGNRDVVLPGSLYGYHPFKLLPSPSTPAKGYDTEHPDLGADPAVAWRAFRVRAGAIGRTNCTGTDGANACPDDPSVNPTASYLDEAMDDEAPIDFVVPENLAAYYVYIDTTVTIPGVTWSENPPTVDSGVDPWMCGKYILIATIDTQTQLAAHKAIVRQYVRSDILEYYKQAVCDSYNNASLVALPGRKTT